GVVAACVWDHAGDRGPVSLFWGAARDLDPAAPDESELAGARRGHLSELLDLAGLSHIAETELAVERAFAGFEDWWAPYTQGVGPAGAHVARLDPDARLELADRCRSLLPSGPFTLSAVAWAARGVV
ncbi:MAG: SAM-dependent methyltransferase, partial [Chloroflexota bacterium]